MKVLTRTRARCGRRLAKVDRHTASERFSVHHDGPWPGDTLRLDKPIIGGVRGGVANPTQWAGLRSGHSRDSRRSRSTLPGLSRVHGYPPDLAFQGCQRYLGSRGQAALRVAVRNSKRAWTVVPSTVRSSTSRTGDSAGKGSLSERTGWNSILFSSTQQPNRPSRAPAINTAGMVGRIIAPALQRPSVVGKAGPIVGRRSFYNTRFLPTGLHVGISAIDRTRPSLSLTVRSPLPPQTTARLSARGITVGRMARCQALHHLSHVFFFKIYIVRKQRGKPSRDGVVPPKEQRRQRSRVRLDKASPREGEGWIFQGMTLASDGGKSPWAAVIVVPATPYAAAWTCWRPFLGLLAAGRGRSGRRSSNQVGKNGCRQSPIPATSPPSPDGAGELPFIGQDPCEPHPPPAASAFRCWTQARPGWTLLLRKKA